MQVIETLDAKGFRQFGLMMAAFIAGIFGLLLPWLWKTTYPIWPWVIAAIFTVWAMVSPMSLNPVYRNWMRVGIFIGGIVNRVILGLVFFLVIWPIGLLLRLKGMDSMRLKLKTKDLSYRIPSISRGKNHIERPF